LDGGPARRSTPPSQVNSAIPMVQPVLRAARPARPSHRGMERWLTCVKCALGVLRDDVAFVAMRFASGSLMAHIAAAPRDMRGERARHFPLSVGRTLRQRRFEGSRHRPSGAAPFYSGPSGTLAGLGDTSPGLVPFPGVPCPQPSSGQPSSRDEISTSSQSVILGPFQQNPVSDHR
jgi:hypothetical protein